MRQTPAPKTSVHRGLRAALAAGTLIVLVAAVALATFTVEPLRGHFWADRGATCGRVETFGSRTRVTAGGTVNEQCLHRAVQLCQAATLTYDQQDLDTDYTITLVSEPAMPALAPCSIAAVWHSVVSEHVVGSGVERCASLDLQSDGLHVDGCGALGTIVVPAH